MSLSAGSLYESRTRFYFIQQTSLDDPGFQEASRSFTNEGKLFRILEIDRTQAPEAAPSTLLLEHDKLYAEAELGVVITELKVRHYRTGGLTLRGGVYGIIGTVALPAWHILFITGCKNVGQVLGKKLYTCTSTLLLALSSQLETDRAEGKKTPMFKSVKQYKEVFEGNRFYKDFFFSGDYDLTRNLQEARSGEFDSYNERFTWNQSMLQEPLKYFEGTNPQFQVPGGSFWLTPLIHGYVAQVGMTPKAGGKVLMTIIARRSRHMAGPRFIKRGLDRYGNVANEVESEQIVEYRPSKLFTRLNRSFSSANGADLQQEGEEGRIHHYDSHSDDLEVADDVSRVFVTSALLLRGSIPCFWNQEPESSAIKRDIHLNLLKDPDWSSSVAHLRDLVGRYQDPERKQGKVFCLNLIRNVEKRARESVLLRPFEVAVGAANSALQADRVVYEHYDFHHNKEGGRDMVSDLACIVEPSIQECGFYCAEMGPSEHPVPQEQWAVESRQAGIIRVNCIDCLDRTNVTQYVIANMLLRQQVAKVVDMYYSAHAGLDRTTAEEEAKMVEQVRRRLTPSQQKMFTAHGDRIATQYAGSGALHKEAIARNSSVTATNKQDFLEQSARARSQSRTSRENSESKSPRDIDSHSLRPPSISEKFDLDKMLSNEPREEEDDTPSPTPAHPQQQQQQQQDKQKTKKSGGGFLKSAKALATNAKSALKRIYYNKYVDGDRQLAISLLAGKVHPRLEFDLAMNDYWRMERELSIGLSNNTQHLREENPEGKQKPFPLSSYFRCPFVLRLPPVVRHTTLHDHSLMARRDSSDDSDLEALAAGEEEAKGPTDSVFKRRASEFDAYMTHEEKNTRDSDLVNRIMIKNPNVLFVVTKSVSPNAPSDTAVVFEAQNANANHADAKFSYAKSKPVVQFHLKSIKSSKTADQPPQYLKSDLNVIDRSFDYGYGFKTKVCGPEALEFSMGKLKKTKETITLTVTESAHTPIAVIFHNNRKQRVLKIHLSFVARKLQRDRLKTVFFYCRDLETHEISIRKIQV